MHFKGAVTISADVDIVTGVGATTTFDSTVTSTGAATFNGTTTINAAQTYAGELTTGVDSTINLGSAFKAGSAAAITAAATSVGTLDQTVNGVTVNVSNQFTTGTVVLFKNSAAALDADDLASFNVTDTAIVDYTAALSTSAKAVEITANKRTTAGIATYLGMSSAQTAALGQITAAVASNDAAASTALDTVLVTGGSTAVNATEQLNPDASAAMGAAMAVTGGVNNIIAGRQANTRVAFNTLGKQSGVSTGDASSDAVVWAQVFTSDATQDKVDNIDGYTTDGQGLVVGWEAEKADSTFGFSLSFAGTDVDGKSAAAAHIDTSSVQGTIYGSNGSTDWMMGYASADNDTTRTINFGGLTRTATGNYASNILMAKAGYSFDSIEMAVATLTPKADLSWTHINNDGYTETGATNLNLIVDNSSNDVVTARMGMEFAQRIESNGAVTIPRVSIMGGYDLNNDRAETTSTFTGGGSSFTTQGIDPSNASLELGVGVDRVSDDSTVSFSYNTNLKDGYNSDTASLTFKSKF
jgi:outer membrane autotransporter protein